MGFENGKFYAHEGGRQIAVVGEVLTYRWGKMIVVEEADKTGHGISCAEIKEDTDIEASGWVEIGREEWMRNFEDQSCEECGKVFQAGDKFVPTTAGPVHIQCYARVIRERGPDIIQPVSLN